MALTWDMEVRDWREAKVRGNSVEDTIQLLGEISLCNDRLPDEIEIELPGGQCARYVRVPNA